MSADDGGTRAEASDEPRPSATGDAHGAVLVVGAGPGIGAAVARRFGAAGHPVGLVARDAGRLHTLAGALRDERLRVEAAPADARDPAALAAAIDDLAGRLGPVAVLCFSPLPDVGGIRPVLDTTPADLDRALALNVTGAAAAVRATLPAMDPGGTLLFTTGGAALEPSAERAVSGVAYAAQTVYVGMLHEALAPAGIHAAQTVIVGPVGPGERHEPAVVAAHLWDRHRLRDAALTTLR